MSTASLPADLTLLVGPEHVAARENCISVTPADTDQVSAVMKFANEHSLTVTPIGGGTKQSWGNAVQPSLYLETTRLNRVIEHPWQDLTCTVQAGCTWQHLQETLKKHNQFVALDPLWPERATVGGILATNDSGALRHKYGSLRDLVIGMTLVLADGTIARSGGKVVKNVAGYDLCKLLTGSLGTLAIITEATFRLHPLPQHAETFTVSAPQAAQLAPLMAGIRASHLLTQSLQLRGDANGFHLDIQLNAHPEAHQSVILREMTAASGLALESTSEDVWLARETLFSNGDSFVVKIGMRPTDITQIADDIVRLGGAVVAQALGVIYAVFPNLQRDSSPLGSLYAYTDTGSMTLLRTPADPLDNPTPPWGPGKPNLLMQRVKDQFDPNNTLNPGRFAQGI